MPKLSDRIKYIRKLRDLSQAQLAEMAGTTQQAIQQA
ncbi:MAG: helix-turn-helix transcriptional regulator, partial [Pseudomonadota bacterium]